MEQLSAVAREVLENHIIIHSEDNTVSITQQLEPKVYQAVKKVFGRIGGS